MKTTPASVELGLLKTYVGLIVHVGRSWIVQEFGGLMKNNTNFSLK